MAKNKNTNVLGQLTNAGNNAVGMINRLDEATGKFQKGRRQGSIVKAAQGNVFEFPVFISSGIPVDYATATSSLLEQIYASYLQMAISINPVVDADSVKNNMQFAGLIREHFQTVVLLLGVIFHCFEALVFVPVFLPFLLNFLKVILLVHFMSNPPLR